MTGAVHEWVGLVEPPETVPSTALANKVPLADWLPPLGILTHLARRALEQGWPGGRVCVLWIGPRIWPYPPTLARPGEARTGDLHDQESPSLLDNSVFVTARSVAERAWAIDVALRSPAVCAVVADATGMRMAESRRFQLAAAAGGGDGGGGALGLLTRPHAELGELSASQTRWLVGPAPSPGDEPRWIVELLRCKGVRPIPEDARRWTVRIDDDTGDLRLVPDAPYRRLAPVGEAQRHTA
jgi:hypothetical protein